MYSTMSSCPAGRGTAVSRLTWSSPRRLRSRTDGTNMKFVSRAELGWPASEAADQVTAKGVKIHYEGTEVSCKTHDQCVSLVKAIRKSHLANTKENYSDIAYNLLVCRHGYVFEGRGKRKRTGANGNQELNRAHYAVMALLGDEGDTTPTPEMIEGIKDAIAYLRS